jgi:hypothetical protein
VRGAPLTRRFWRAGGAPVLNFDAAGECRRASVAIATRATAIADAEWVAVG